MYHEFTSVPVAGVRNIIFKTGSKGVIIKLRSLSFNGSTKVEYRAYADVTYTGGTAVAVGNENQIQPQASTVTVLSDATVNSYPSSFRRYVVYSSSGGTGNNNSRLGQDISGLETILKPNTTYAITLTNVSGNAADMQLNFNWYEGGTDLPAED